jgi:hypothetical protein
LGAGEWGRDTMALAVRIELGSETDARYCRDCPWRTNMGMSCKLFTDENGLERMATDYCGDWDDTTAERVRHAECVGAGATP